MAAIALRQVGKIFPNGHAAARDVSIDIADGELLVLLGPSGSGKSTVLRLIAGLETPTSGAVFIDGRDVTAVAPQDRDLAMVFQSYALYPHKSVRENLAFGLRLRRIAAAQIDERVRTVATSLGIETLLDRRPAQLSGGQRQRVALGRAIVREPKAFLLDEPLSNLDPQTRVGTRTELALLHRRLGATMVYVTHDQEEAMTLGTRVAVMREGLVEQLAPPLDLYRHPANAFVAAFVGAPEMNLVQGTLAPGPHGAGLRFACPAFAVELRDNTDAPPSGESGVPRPLKQSPTEQSPLGPCLLGIRPHDVELTSPADGHGHGQAAIVEPLGATTVVHLRVDGLPDRLLRIVVPADTATAVGDRVGFRLDLGRVHLFDEPGGHRLR